MEDTIEIRFDWGRVYRLMSSHGLDRSQASQVVQGQLCLDKVVHRRRRSDHLKKYLGHCTFAKAVRDGRPRLFALHGQRVQLMRIKANRRYEVDFLPLGPDLRPSGELATAHKLQFKLGAHVDHMPKIQGSIDVSWSDARATEPIPKPQDRYFISDNKLFGWVNAANTICVKTLEGEMVKGTLSWIGRWELGLDVNGGELVVFRHALANIQGFRWGSLKDD